MDSIELQLLKEELAGRYRFDREIGRGGWGAVYLADDLKLKHQVAIKVIVAGEESVGSRRKFRQEAEIEARLGHTNIVPVFDIGEAGDAMYFVMRYVEGGSLEDRIRESGVLPIPEALQLTRQVAAALAHAHANHVVHCDIKPGNILLGPGGAQVADFGIAKHFGPPRSDGRIRTDSTVGAGTVAYMPPEQMDRSAGGRVDGRSDLYALGCVLFEMLTGRLPFRTTSPAEMIEMHARATRPVVSDHREGVPRSLDELVMRMMATDVADRPATAEEVIAQLDAIALEVARSGEHPMPRPRPRALVVAVALVTLALAGAWLGGRPGDAGGDPASLDTTLIALIPFEGDSAAASAVEARLRRHLVSWTGLRLVDPFQAAEALGGSGRSHRSLRRAAAALGAGRFIRGSVTSGARGVEVTLVLLASEGASTPVAQASGRSEDLFASVDSLTPALAWSLFIRAPPSPDLALGSPGTRSLPALQAYARGRRLVLDWALDSAEAAFATAYERDGEFTDAAFWLALTRFWLRRDATAWQLAARAAARDARPERALQRSLAAALVDVATGDRARGCDALAAATRRAPLDFVAWYSSAECGDRDFEIVRDARSPSGWRFRRSYQEVVAGYLQAFQLFPHAHRALKDDSFERVRILLGLSTSEMRLGRSADGREVRPAQLWLLNDTLAFLPYPMDVVTGADPAYAASQRASSRAVQQRQRQIFRDLAAMWVATDPASASAHEAHALALQLLDQRAALDTLARAITLATGPGERMQLAPTEAWVRLRFALPDDTGALRRITAVADSALDAAADQTTLRSRASLAVLVGRLALAESLVTRLARSRGTRLPDAARAPAARLALGAGLGIDPEELDLLARRTDSLITALLPPDSVPAARAEAFTQAARLASIRRVDASWYAHANERDRVVAILRAIQRRDSAATRDGVTQLIALRRTVPPAEASMDAIIVEAATISRFGHTQLAVSWLDEALAAQRRSPPPANPVAAASLMTAMRLRAELGATIGDAVGARRWNAALSALWRQPDT